MKLTTEQKAQCWDDIDRFVETLKEKAVQQETERAKGIGLAFADSVASMKRSIEFLISEFGAIPTPKPSSPR